MMMNVEERKVYNEEWYRKNKKRVKKKQKEYYQTHKKEKKEYDKKYRQNHKEERKLYLMKYHQKHKKRARLYYRQYNRKNKKVVLEYYGGKPPKCACCGEFRIEFLTIDHINGGGTQHREKVGRGTVFYHWLIKQNFPEGYQVLCFNCNCAKGFYGYCPHEREKLK